jgi:outer membrane biosynthesis protein TonB
MLEKVVLPGIGEGWKDDKNVLLVNPAGAVIRRDEDVLMRVGKLDDGWKLATEEQATGFVKQPAQHGPYPGPGPQPQPGHQPGPGPQPQPGPYPGPGPQPQPGPKHEPPPSKPSHK